MKSFYRLLESAETDRERNAIISNIFQELYDGIDYFTSFLVLSDHFAEYDPVDMFQSKLYKYIGVKKIKHVYLSTLDYGDEYFEFIDIGRIRKLEIQHPSDNDYPDAPRLVFPIGDDFENFS